MMKQTLTKKLYASDLFDSLGKENEQELDGKPLIQPNKSLEYLTKKYEEFIKEAISYIKAEKLYKRLKFDNKYLTSKNIEQFSLYLSNYQKLENFYLSGYFLSKAINDSKDKEFTIHTKHLDSLINDLGYKNDGKTITVNGNVRNFVGFSMKNGDITVNGNAGDNSGFFMENGSITINGDAGDWVGFFMENGNSGNSMQDRTINLNGDYQSLSDYIYGGNIYHKDKLIVKNGRMVE